MAAGMKSHAEVAVAFATALAAGDFARVHARLVPELRQQLTAADLRNTWSELFHGESDGEPKHIYFDPEFVWEDWRTKRPGDRGRVYVGISADGVVEAVTVTVADVGGELLIRELQWGRP